MNYRATCRRAAARGVRRHWRTIRILRRFASNSSMSRRCRKCRSGSRSRRPFSSMARKRCAARSRRPARRARRADRPDPREAAVDRGAAAMRAETRAAISFLAPAVIVLGLFFFLPVIAGFALSLTDFDLYSIGDVHNVRFIALRNYKEVLTNGVFWTALLNTLYFSLVGGPLTVAASLGAALLVNAKAARWKPLFRTIYFAPVVTTLVAVAVVFRFLYKIGRAHV